MARVDVIWHRICDPRHRFLRDYGLACGHVLAHRPMPRLNGHSHIPKHVTCPHCAKGKVASAPTFPVGVVRTTAGWVITQALSRAADAKKAAERPVSAPLPLSPPLPQESALDEQGPGFAPAPPARRSSRITASWSPRDLAARNLD